GIHMELERLFGPEEAPRLLDRYLALEPEAQRGAYRLYSEVLGLTLERLVREEDLALPEGEEPALARSLPEWGPFPEVPAALGEEADPDPDLELRDLGQLPSVLDEVVPAGS